MGSGLIEAMFRMNPKLCAGATKDETSRVIEPRTKGLTQGSYRLYIDLGDGVERTVDVGLS